MEKIDFYKPTGKNKNREPKSIIEISEELKERLENRGIKPDSYFLSSNYKSIQKNPFPAGRKISGTLSVGSGEINAFLSLAGDEESELKGRIFIASYKIEDGNIAEAFEKASEALKTMLAGFWLDSGEKIQLRQADIIYNQQPVIKGIREADNPGEIAKSVQQALLNPEVVKELEKLQAYSKDAGIESSQGRQQKTITIPTGNKALVDDKIIDIASRKTGTTDIISKEQISAGNGKSSNESNSSFKNQLINVDFTPEQADVVVQLLEESQKKYEPKSSMFKLLGDVLGKMLHALSRKLDEIIDIEKINNEKLNSVYAAVNAENYELFVDKYKGLEQKLKYCHEILCEAAKGQSIYSTEIINHVLSKEKIPVSIRTLQNAFASSIKSNVSSALCLFRYADANLHGEAHSDTIRNFLSHALNVLPDSEAEKFINVSSVGAFDGILLFKEMIRAEKYTLLNTSLQRCDNINEYAPALYFFSAQRKDIEALHLLAGKGANPNANDGEVLYACYEANKPEAAKILINFGADANLLQKRLETIYALNPNYNPTQANLNFLDEIYKYCGWGGLAEAVENRDEVYGENGDLGAHDGSWG